MMNLKEAYSYAVQFLSRNGIEEADFKALCIVCHLVDIKNSQYRQHINDPVSMKKLADLLWRIKTGEPLQYVIGKWDFYNSEFFVGKGVLIPRPETEELVERVTSKVRAFDNCVVYDLCAGSGCIGLSIAKECKNATVYLIEKSEEAFGYLEKNAKGINNAHIILGDINDAFDLPKADIIVSNPPYIQSKDIALLQKEVQQEPAMALDGGKDGLDFYRIINDNWASKINKNGFLFLEIGNEQGKTIIPVLNNFQNINVIKDLYGNNRMVEAVVKD